MKTGMKKIIASILVALMMLSIIGASGLAEAPAVFNASVSLSPSNTAPVKGESVTVALNVANANMGYTVQWEKKTVDEFGNEVWVPVGNGESLTLTASEENAATTFRAVLIGADQTVIISGTYKMSIREEEPVVEEPVVEEPAPVVEEAPTVEEPAPVEEEIPAEEVAPIIVEEIPAEEIPAEEEAPIVEEIPAEEIPAEEEAPAEEIPAEEEATVEEIPAEEAATVEEIPAEEAATVEEIPAEEEAPVEEIPAEEVAPVVEETPAEEIPAEEEAPVVKEIPAEEISTEEEVPAEEIPAEEIPAEEETPVVEEIPAEEISTEEEVPAEEIPAAEETPVEEIPAEEIPTEEAAPVEEDVPTEEFADEDEGLIVYEESAEIEEEIDEYEAALGLYDLQYVVTAKEANIRTEADGMSPIMTTVAEGTALRGFVTDDGDWMMVAINGELGYVYKKDLVSTEEETVEEVVEEITEVTAEEETEELTEEAAEEEAVEEIPEETAEEEAAAEETAEAEEVLPELKVTIFTSRRVSMTLGEPVYLTSELEGFEGFETAFQWECDKGEGFEPVEGANEDSYSYEASKESLSWMWRLTVRIL